MLLSLVKLMGERRGGLTKQDGIIKSHICDSKDSLSSVVTENATQVMAMLVKGHAGPTVFST